MITAVCVALTVVLPMAFHAVPNAGSVILPMHIPVLLCGLICGWPFGLACGLIGPLLSNLFTGMPPMAALPAMLVELAVYGLMAGLLMSCVRTRKVYADLYISLLVAMLAGRIVAGMARALIFAAGSYSMLPGQPVICYFIAGHRHRIVLLLSIVFALRYRLIPHAIEEIVLDGSGLGQLGISDYANERPACCLRQGCFALVRCICQPAVRLLQISLQRATMLDKREVAALDRAPSWDKSAPTTLRLLLSSIMESKRGSLF